MLKLIQHMITHRTAPNLGMILALVFGAMSIYALNVQLWPTYTAKHVYVTIAHKGATAGTMDRVVGRVLDDALNSLHGVDQVWTNSSAGVTNATIKFHDYKDLEEGRSEVQAAVDAIQTFPAGIERPTVRIQQPTELVARLLVSGPFDDQARDYLASHLNNSFKAAGIGNTKVSGIPARDLVVSLDPLSIRQHNISVGQISRTLKAAIETLPSGTLKSANTFQATRTLASNDETSLGEILITSAGKPLRLGDIATIARAAPETAIKVVFPEGNGFFIEFRRNVNENVLTVSDKIRETLNQLRAELPKTIVMKLYDVRADQIKDRLNLLYYNAGIGLLLVAAALFIFLNLQAAIWVAIGIPTAFAMTFMIMWISNQSINMVSAFAMVMVLGIIVDDAIVVAENISREKKQGEDPHVSTFRGTRQMMRPVFTATLTTIAAFVPILFLSDIIGSYVAAIPYFVCAALLASLLECFFLLPGHMRGRAYASTRKTPAVRAALDRLFGGFVETVFHRLISTAHRFFLISIAILVAIAGFAAFLSSSNLVRFQFWLNPESNFLFANFTLASEGSHEENENVAKALWAGMEKAERSLGYKKGELIKVTLGLSGAQFGKYNTQPSPYQGAVLVELSDESGQRVHSDEFIKIWRESVGSIAGLNSLEIARHKSGPDGADVHMTVNGESADNVNHAVADLQRALGRIDGVTNIRNNLTTTVPEIQFAVSDQGRQLGFTSQIIGRKLYEALHGSTASRITVDERQVDVVVKLQSIASIYDLLSYVQLENNEGKRAEFLDVVTLSYGNSEGWLRRTNSQLSAAVLADVDTNVVDAAAVWRKLDRDTLPSISLDRDVKITFGGKRKERTRALEQIAIATLVALASMYCILAWSMASFSIPIGIILVLPMGVAGAVIGHWVMNLSMTILSLAAMVALSGILVNDTIILFDRIYGNLRQGMSRRMATIEGYKNRFRAVFLTSLTTIVGLAPLMVETSYQAQFLIPIAVTITWGLGFATVTSFLLVPAIFAIGRD